MEPSEKIGVTIAKAWAGGNARAGESHADRRSTLSVALPPRPKPPLGRPLPPPPSQPCP